METQYHHIKRLRRHSHLSQGEIAFLLGLKGLSVLSRYEAGKRLPHAKHLLMLHLVFGTPIEALYGAHKDALREEIIDRLAKLHSKCEAKGGSAKIQRRKAFLEAALTRLTDNTYGN